MQDKEKKILELAAEQWVDLIVNHLTYQKKINNSFITNHNEENKYEKSNL